MDTITLKKGNDLLKKQKELKEIVEIVRTALVDKQFVNLRILRKNSTLVINSFSKEIMTSTLELILATSQKEYIEITRQLEAL